MGIRRPLTPLLIGGTLALAIALTMLSGGRFSARTGYDEAARQVALSDWWTLWAIPPVEVALVTLLLAVLVVQIRRTADASHRRRQRRYAVAAVATLLISVASPLAGLAQGGLFAAHMTQHVVIGGVASLLTLLALRSARHERPTTNRVMVFLTHPLIAFGLWVASTVAWLIPHVHHSVLDNQWLWIGQQVSFFVFGVLLWASITERLTIPPRWFGTGAKCGYMVGVWSIGLITANFYWFAGRPLYSGHSAAADAWGVSPLQDQANAATVMMVSHCALAFGAIAILFFRHASEQGLEQRLVEAGVDANQARTAILRGDGARLADELGVPTGTRTGID